MKHTRIIALILALALLVPCLPMAGHAADEPEFSVTVSPETAAIGGQTVVTVALEGYDTASIAGLQVDITGIDTGVLQVVDYASAIEDTTALSNKVSYNTANQRVRLLYFRQSGTLPAPCEDVLKLTLQISPDLTEKGSVTLPLTVKIVTADSQQITLTSSCTINYADVVAAARNESTGTDYATLAEALADAKSGETVTLTADCEENRVLVTPGTTLDLNGHTLTANYVVGFNTSAILDSSNSEANGYVPQGLLAVDPDNMVLYEGNGAVPVYNSEKGGYIFVDFLFQAKATSDGDVAQINMLVTSRTLEVIDLLKDGAEDNDIQIVVRLTWDSETGTAYQDFVFNEDTIQNVMKSNTGTYGGFERMFYVNVSGINELTGVTATAMVIAGSNAVDAGKTLNVN